MVIKELSTTNYKHAVVELSYDELRCISNSLHQICKISSNIDADYDVDLMYAKMLELFCLVKHGHIPEFELKVIQKSIDKYNEENKERK